MGEEEIYSDIEEFEEICIGAFPQGDGTLTPHCLNVSYT